MATPTKVISRSPSAARVCGDRLSESKGLAWGVKENCDLENLLFFQTDILTNWQGESLQYMRSRLCSAIFSGMKDSGSAQETCGHTLR